MKAILTLVLTIFFLNSIYSQIPQTDSLSKAKIKKLSFLVGNWSGKGWMMMNNLKSEFDQTERIQFKLDSTAVLIEGKGSVNGKIVHDALAIISYNKEDENYLFKSYLATGNTGEFTAELKDDKLFWYPNDTIRYIIWKNDKEQWYEKGEYKKDEEWHQFFEMTLNKED